MVKQKYCTRYEFTAALVYPAMPKGKFEVQQKQLEELPMRRPLILYLIAPVYSKDHAQFTGQNKLFKPDPSLPNGVRVRASKAGSGFNFCLIEASPNLERLKEQVSATLEHFKETAHKVLVVNAHGVPEGVVLKDEPGERVIIDGRQFAELVTPHTHRHNLHVIVFASYAHVFSDQFYEYAKKGCPPEVTEVTAITYFTSEATPTAWDKITTAGNGHVEVTRELGEFVKTNIEPNSPYKILESKVQPGCTIL